MDPSEFNLPQSLPPPSLVSEIVWSHHPMENPPQNQQYEKEQSEPEQPELELNLTPGPPPLPMTPLGLLEQNPPPWPLQTPPWLWTWQQSEQEQEIQWVRPQQFDSAVEWLKEQSQVELNLTPGPPPLPMPPLGLLEQNPPPWPLQTPPWLWTWQQSEQEQELGLNVTPSPLPPHPPEPPLKWREREILQSLERALLGDEAVGVVGTGEGETELDKLNSGCLGHEKSKENTPRGESGNNKTIDVRIACPLGDVLQTEGLIVKDATKDLNVSDSHPNETPAFDDEEGFPQLNSDPLASDQVVASDQVAAVIVEDFGIDEVEDVEMCPKSKENDGMSLKGAAEDVNVISDTLLSDEASAVTVDANSVVAKDIPPLQFSATDQQDNPDEDFGNDELGEVEIYLERTESGRIAEPQFESRCFVKRKRKEKIPGEERRNKKTGVRIGTPSEDSLQTKGVSPKDNAKHLKGETLRNTSKGGLAESNVNVNTVGGRASLKKRSTSFSRKGGIKIDKPCLTEITSENEGEVLERVFRSSLRGIMRLIKELNLRTCHKKVLKKTPFWGIFEAIIENKLSAMQCHQRGMMIIKIIKTYDPITRKFRIGRESMELTPADMASIFGISCGNERVSLIYCYQEDVKLVARREISKSWLSSESLKHLLKKYVGSDEKDDVEDVARLLCVYLCHTFFFATGPRVKWVYLKLIEDLDRMRDYDWNGAIINELMSSITAYHSKPWKVTGCVMALLYWLCEHTNLFKANHSEHPLGIVKWNIPLVVSRLKEIRLKDLKPRQVVSRQANVARTVDDEVPVDKGIVQDLVSLGDVLVSKRRTGACLGNGKKDEKTPIGERVGRSALKRVRPHYNIHRSSPRDEHNLIGQERIPQSNSDPLLPPNQVNDTMKTNSVTVKARYGKETIKFRLSQPWRMVELKQQVKKRLELKAGTYCIRYKDENDELILIACDEDLQDCISNSSQLGTSSIEVFLESK